MSADVYDLIIIGAGPGGYVTAIRAAQLGLRTAIVEREHLGGICLNWGCIPTKALLRSAEIYRYARNAADFGLKIDGAVGFDAAAVVNRSRGVSGQLNAGVGFLLKKNKVDVLWGEANITSAPRGADPGRVVVSVPTKKAVEPQHPRPKGVLPTGTYFARHIIVATGARPRVLPGVEPDGQLIWSYFEAMVPDAMPKSLIIMGTGAIGIEFASFYRTMGSDVTLIEMMPQILPVEDAEIAALARKQFEKQGMRILCGAAVKSVTKVPNAVIATVDLGGGKTGQITADRLISAVGVRGNVEGLGLDALGVKTERGCIVVDGMGRTSVPGIYAIGDVAGPPMLAHKAEHEGVICVEGIKGLHPHAMDKAKIPGCTYCHPQIASVGLTEAKARQAGHTLKVGRFPFRANGKAMALGEPEGLVKTIFDAETGQLLGAHMIGAEVTELIQGYVVAMGLETTEEDLMHAVFPHPTLSEMMHESVLDAFHRVIHA
ncbi:MAG: dihydrolipoyl dehydrogenase [Hyphomicrobium sp.]|nr:MAG: dihydrolipoyl dehydrogenase [Hyphomicrobium sp.]